MKTAICVFIIIGSDYAEYLTGHELDGTTGSFCGAVLGVVIALDIMNMIKGFFISE